MGNLPNVTAINGEPIAGFQNNPARRGRFHYVHAALGNDNGSGKSWARATATLDAAFDRLESGDTIVVAGDIREQLTTPAQVFDVTIVGAGNRPRHADSSPAPLGGQGAVKWRAPAVPVAATPLVTVLQQGWRFQNILFAGPTDAACIQLFRNGGAGDLERDASHAEILTCRFASGRDGVEQSGGCYNVKIADSAFHDLTGTALKTTAGAGIAAPYRWEILRNRFAGCVNLMGAWSARQFVIKWNDVKEITTLYLNLSGGSHNTVVDNTFDVTAANFDPTGNVRGSTTDSWANYLIDAYEVGLPAD